MEIHSNLCKVEVIDARYLNDIEIYNDKIFLKYWRNFKRLNVAPYSATLEVTDKIENKSRIYTTKISFLTENKIVNNSTNYAFRVTTFDFEQYLIGTSEPPFCTITNSEKFPDNATGQCGNVVTIEFVNDFGPLKIEG